MNTVTRRLFALAASTLIAGACNDTPTQPAPSTPIAFARLWPTAEEADKNKDGLVCMNADLTAFTDYRKSGCPEGFTLGTRF